MQNTQNKVQTLKILPITLKLVPQIFQASQRFYKAYRSCTFQHISFIARVISPAPNLILSDETGQISTSIHRREFLTNFELGCYYQCLCKMKTIGSSWKLEIINKSVIQGNQITTHMLRVITQEMKRKNIEMQVLDEKRIKQQREQQKQEQLYWRMREWTHNKQKFTLQELELEFLQGSDRNLFNNVLMRIQDQQLVGFMGNHYQWL